MKAISAPPRHCEAGGFAARADRQAADRTPPRGKSAEGRRRHDQAARRHRRPAEGARQPVGCHAFDAAQQRRLDRRELFVHRGADRAGRRPARKMPDRVAHFGYGAGQVRRGRGTGLRGAAADEGRRPGQDLPAGLFYVGSALRTGARTDGDRHGRFRRRPAGRLSRPHHVDCFGERIYAQDHPNAFLARQPGLCREDRRRERRATENRPLRRWTACRSGSGAGSCSG